MLQALKAQPRAAQVCFFCVWLDLLGPIPCNDARLGTNCIVERDFISRNRIDDMPPTWEQDNRQLGWKGQLRRLYNFAQLKSRCGLGTGANLLVRCWIMHQKYQEAGSESQLSISQPVDIFLNQLSCDLTPDLSTSVENKFSGTSICGLTC